jgi:hypothetical protein
MTRSLWASASDRDLLVQCDVDTYRASGPGGQKRNKTSSAVRLRHGPTGLIAIAEESRSQHDNKARALDRMRRLLWLELREPADGDRAEIAAIREADGRLAVSSVRDPRYWPAIACVLDRLAGAGGQVRTAATALGTTTANVIQLLELDDRVWQAANRIRAGAGLKLLKTDA